MNRDTKQSCHHPSNSLKYIYKTQAVFPKPVPVFWETKESHRTAECEESLKEPCAVEANSTAREHRGKEGHSLMTRAGQHGDLLRLQGTLDHCLLKAVKLMNEVQMDGPKRGGAMLGVGPRLTQKSNKEPKGLQGAPTQVSHKGRTTHLYPIQQFAHAPKAVGFYASQHVLRQIGHVKVLHVLFCKTRGEESPEVFSKKWRQRQSLVSSTGSLRPGESQANTMPRNRGLPSPSPCQVGKRVPGRLLRISLQR